MTSPIEIMALGQCTRWNWRWDKMTEGRRELSRSEMRVIVSALNDAGFVILPKEPTREMLEACAPHYLYSSDAGGDFYRAMVEAGKVRP